MAGSGGIGINVNSELGLDSAFGGLWDSVQGLLGIRKEEGYQDRSQNAYDFGDLNLQIVNNGASPSNSFNPTWLLLIAAFIVIIFILFPQKTTA